MFKMPPIKPHVKVDSAGSWTSRIPAEYLKPGNLLRDISGQAIWTVSSCKPGFGVQQLLADSADNYWQSDGSQPHTITIEFPKKTDVCFVLIYLDFKNDESYTPSKMIARMGNSSEQLSESTSITFHEPNGWELIDLRKKDKSPGRSFVVELQVVQNHQNGRDTHVRHVRILGPQKTLYCPEARLALAHAKAPSEVVLPDEGGLRETSRVSYSFAGRNNQLNWDKLYTFNSIR